MVAYRSDTFPGCWVELRAAVSGEPCRAGGL